MLASFGRNWLGAALWVALTLAAPARAEALPPPEELIFFVQYIGTDYGVAVRDGRVIDAEEHQELLHLAGTAADRYAGLRPKGSARSDLTRLQELIRARASWDAVRSLSRELVPRLVDELEVASFPDRLPDLERGRALFGEDCAPCHGTVGGGDGRASPGLVPRPTSFREPRMALVSPHEVFNATSFGVVGTAMPSFREGLPATDLWDLAFFVMTLRDGFDGSEPIEVVPLPLKEIAARSDEELLTRLRASRPGAQAAELDYYRARTRGTAPPEPAGAAPSDDPGLALASQLERTFASVADKVFPAVVGVTVYEPDAKAPPGAGWTVGDGEERVYPGLRPVLRGTGFLVSGDGDVLTRAGAVSKPGATPPAGSVIDVELAGNIHCRARLIGVEPTVDLAVLKIVAPIPLRPVTIGDSDGVRVGHWAIAVGDPAGPEKIFVPGTIAARPERECYQEHRTSTLLQSSVAMDPAGFGGPLVNIRGEAVGLTIPGPGSASAPFGPGARPVSALPINLAMTLYRALKVKESDRSPWIGISVLDLSARVRSRLESPPLTGIYIDDVFDPSPASRAGIRVGDVLTLMDDHPILAVADFQTWLYLLGIDAPVRLTIVRDGKTLVKPVVIAERPPSAVSR